MDEELKKNVLKSGTTILGIVCKDGVVLAGDRKATVANSIVVLKNERKVTQINDYVLMAGMGGAADIQKTEKLAAAELKLKELRSKARPTIRQAANLIGNITYQSIRNPSMVQHIVGSLVAGVNEDGSTELYTIEPAGGVYKVEEYDANLSSGMPYVLGLLERQYKRDMSIQEGVELAKEALKSSTERDVASGCGIDVFTVTKEGIKQVVRQEIQPTYKDR